MSRLSATVSVLLVRKLSGEIQFYVNYRGLNNIIVKNQYPLLLIREILNRLSQAKFYTKLNIIAAFNYIYIKESKE